MRSHIARKVNKIMRLFEPQDLLAFNEVTKEAWVVGRVITRVDFNKAGYAIHSGLLEPLPKNTGVGMKYYKKKVLPFDTLRRDYVYEQEGDQF